MKHQNIFLSFVLAAGSMLGQETSNPVEKKAGEGTIEKGLGKVGKAVDKAAHKTAELGKEAGKKTVEVTKSAAAATEKGAKKTVEVTKEAGKKTGEITKDVAKKTASGTESVAKKTTAATGSGIEKTGKAIKGTRQLDINSASAADMKREMGVTDEVAGKIIQGRPYKMKNQLNSKDILSDAQYEKVKDKIIAKQK